MRSRGLTWAWMLRGTLGGAFLCCLLLSAAAAGPFEETIQVLEQQTSFHWGRDCLVWIVHYPEELVDPWVESEALRTGMTESERQSYRESFVSDLSIGRAEPFLFTVYAFGPRPLSFAPLSEKVALVTPDGKRVKPLRYDRVLDQPVNGVVQGLIFFPKQKFEGYALAVRGMGVYDERLFAFDHSSSPLENFAVQKPDEEPEIVVVELPPAPKKPSPPRAPRPVAPKAIERPQPAPPPAPPAPEIVVVEPESESMADFVEAMRRGDGQKEGDAGRGEDLSEQDNAYVSREKTVRTFLDLWAASDFEKMYAMLSTASREIFSQEAFASEVKKSADFRVALKDGYRIDWTTPERAKIVAVRRVLLIRTLVTRTLGVLRESATWKIVW
ncbi:MAG: hypothetical protein LBQ90_01105 [Synergistaceae bacterium]|nr:hypothetical protein [Synergistaceae bacterium]